MRKPAIFICENKVTDQLRDNREADQRLCFRYIDSTIPLLPTPLAIFCSRTARFVSDLIGNPEDRFCRDAAHMNMHSYLITICFHCISYCQVIGKHFSKLYHNDPRLLC